MIAVLEKILDFLTDYWIYLTLVFGSLILLVIISVILNARAKVREDESPEVSPLSPEPAPEPKLEVVDAEVMNPDHVSVPDPETPGEPFADPEPESKPAEVTQPPLVDPIPEPLPVPESPEPESQKPEKLPPKPKKVLGKYHVMYRTDGKWYVKREGSTTVLRVLETQKEALSWAIIKAYPQNIGIVVHDKDGKIKKTELL
jgi:outer membrane biosynthesis protein TonB